MPAVRNGSRLFAEWHIVILIAADLTRFLALAFGTTESGLAHITPSMDEASRTLGKSTSQTLYSVHVPNSKCIPPSGSELAAGQNQS